MGFRSTRYTNNLTPIVEFYTRILGLEILFSFEDHNGYKGVMLGNADQDWH